MWQARCAFEGSPIAAAVLNVTSDLLAELPQNRLVTAAVIAGSKVGQARWQGGIYCTCTAQSITLCMHLCIRLPRTIPHFEVRTVTSNLNVACRAPMRPTL